MKICAGIISYFPDDINLKILRVKRLNELIRQIDYIFNIPIMIIAQNWKGISLREGTTRKPIIIHNYKEGLGINKARQTLREKFLESDFDYIIMLDDDSVLRGDPQGGRAYLKDIENHPGGFCEFKQSLLKLFAISKDLFSLVNYPEGGADDKDPQMRVFEDMFLCRALKLVYPEKRFIHKMNPHLMELSDAAYDKGNTGWHRVYEESFRNRKWDRHDTGGNTRYMLSQVNKDNLLNPEKILRRDINDPRTDIWCALDSVEKYGKFKK